MEKKILNSFFLEDEDWQDNLPSEEEGEETEEDLEEDLELDEDEEETE